MSGRRKNLSNLDAWNRVLRRWTKRLNKLQKTNYKLVIPRKDNPYYTQIKMEYNAEIGVNDLPQGPYLGVSEVPDNFGRLVDNDVVPYDPKFDL